MKIIGIDPAPSKNSTVYDGESFKEFKPHELIKYVKCLEIKNDVLIAWDAPLTGPGEDVDGDFYYRPIERKLTALIKNIDGVSVRPYAGCPHWAITKATLGYPILSQREKLDNYPFMMISSPEKKGLNLVEVHPAVALYYWIGDCIQKYKGINKSEERTAVNYNYGALKEKLESHTDINFPDVKENNDNLDAFVAYLLGYLWLNDKEKVKLYGNNNAGSMLLPRTDELDKELVFKKQTTQHQIN